MADRKLSQLGLIKELSDKIRARNLFTVKDILSRSREDLLELLDLRIDQIDEIIKFISLKVTPPSQTVLELKNKKSQKENATNYLSTGIHSLDVALFGGIPLGVLTEIVGPSGIGKTQLCLMLSIQCTLPVDLGGLDGEVIYIDTERRFSSVRLVEIASNRFPHLFSSQISVEKLASKILVIVPDSFSNFINTLDKVQKMIKKKNIKLMIIDSVPAILNYKDDSLNAFETIGKICSNLKYLAYKFFIPVIVTNQVMRMKKKFSTATYDFVKNEHPYEQTTSSSIIASSSTSSSSFFASSSSSSVSSSIVSSTLGLHWAHSVNIRLVLEMIHGQSRLKIAKSPMSQVLSFPFEIWSRGLTLIESNENELETKNCSIMAIHGNDT